MNKLFAWEAPVQIIAYKNFFTLDVLLFLELLILRPIAAPESSLQVSRDWGCGGLGQVIL